MVTKFNAFQGQPNTIITQQPQSMQLQQQRSQGNIIITTTTNSNQQTIQLQQPTSIQVQQVQAALQQHQHGSAIRPTVIQSVVRPLIGQHNAQPITTQQPGSQQVQLRVANDDVNRQFCLSWLKATYELGPGCSIEQQVKIRAFSHFEAECCIT